MRQNTVRQAREGRGKTQEWLAKEAGITRPYLSEIENGKVNPGTDVALKIARALETTVESLFFDHSVHRGEQVC